MKKTSPSLLPPRARALGAAALETVVGGGGSFKPGTPTIEDSSTGFPIRPGNPS